MAQSEPWARAIRWRPTSPRTWPRQGHQGTAQDCGCWCQSGTQKQPLPRQEQEGMKRELGYWEGQRSCQLPLAQLLPLCPLSREGSLAVTSMLGPFRLLEVLGCSHDRTGLSCDLGGKTMPSSVPPGGVGLATTKNLQTTPLCLPESVGGSGGRTWCSFVCPRRCPTLQASMAAWKL